MIAEYKRIVAACPTRPVSNAAATFGFDSSSSSPVTSSYRSYPRRSLYDGGGKEFFFMILNPIQKTGARSGSAQIIDFFTTFGRSSSAGMPIPNFQLFCMDHRPLPGMGKDNFLKIFSSRAAGRVRTKKSFFLNYFPRPGSELNRNIFNNLMNALPAQIKLICNLAERRTRGAHLQNFGISVLICGRPRLQWTPLPTGNSLDGRCALFRKLIFSASLANIPNPSSQCDIRIINNFGMNCRNITMSLALRKLRKSFNIGIESCRVVHVGKISTTFTYSWKQLTNLYFLQQTLTFWMPAVSLYPAHRRHA